MHPNRVGTNRNARQAVKWARLAAEHGDARAQTMLAHCYPPEIKYSRHFDGEFRPRNCLGIEVMLDLHTNAAEQCFVEARRRFDVQLLRESVPQLKELGQVLRDHDGALSMGVDVALGTHTVTVFPDGPQLFVRDTGRRGFHAISGLQDIGKLVDSVLYVAK